MKLGIIGSRSFTNYEDLRNEILSYYDVSNIDYVVSGGAYGADQLGERFAKEFNIPVMIFEADWNTYGESAGFIRNQIIIDSSDEIIAFWDGSSPGTSDSINIAIKIFKPINIIDINNIIKQDDKNKIKELLIKRKLK